MKSLTRVWTCNPTSGQLHKVFHPSAVITSAFGPLCRRVFSMTCVCWAVHTSCILILSVACVCWTVQTFIGLWVSELGVRTGCRKKKKKKKKKSTFWFVKSSKIFPSTGTCLFKDILCRFMSWSVLSILELIFYNILLELWCPYDGTPDIEALLSTRM